MNNELKHFGVLGMKWGRHKGSSDTKEYKVTKVKQKEDPAGAVLEYSIKKLQGKKMKDLEPGTMHRGKTILAGKLTAYGLMTLPILVSYLENKNVTFIWPPKFSTTYYKL